MDSNKIGKLIYELRQKNNLTQKELADKLSVTSQAISKWENGRGIPDIEMLQKLSELFNVNIDDILNGELNKNKSQSSKKYIVLISAVLIIVILLLILFFKGSNNDFQITKLASNNDAFSIKGIIAYNENKKSIYISKVEYDNIDDEEKYQNLECILYEVNGNVEKKISQCGTVENKHENQQVSTLSELLKDIEFNVDNYSCSCNTPVCNQLYLKINAVNTNNQTITYNIPIELENSCVHSD